MDKTQKENAWLTRFALVMADKPQTLDFKVQPDGVSIISSVNKELYYKCVKV